MKKRTIIIAGILILAVIASVVGITMAYLTDTDSATNTFTVGTLEITLTEPNWSEDDGKYMIPGDTRLKDPTVTVIENNCYVRFVVKLVDTETGTVITDTSRANKIMQTLRYDSTYNPASGTEGTVLSENGSYALSDLTNIPTVNPGFVLDSTISSAGTKYYCCNSIKNEGDKAVLFTDIVIPTDWGNADMTLLGGFKIEVSAQAIQSGNFKNAADAFGALNAELGITAS